MFRSTGPAKTPTDWATLRPVRSKPHEQRGADDAGYPLVSVLLPRFRNRLLQQWAVRMNLRPFRLKLDAVGSFVWLQCDGDKSVAELGEAMLAEFGDKVEPVEERLTKFLGQLSRGGIVKLEGLEAVRQSTSTERRTSSSEQVTA